MMRSLHSDFSDFKKTDSEMTMSQTWALWTIAGELEKIRKEMENSNE